MTKSIIGIAATLVILTFGGIALLGWIIDNNAPSEGKTPFFGAPVVSNADTAATSEE